MTNYGVEVLIDGVNSMLVDCNGGGEDVTRKFYEEICKAEKNGANADEFDRILASHGCSSEGAGVAYDLPWQGFEAKTRDDGSRYVTSGAGYEIVNLEHIPEITTSFVPQGRWERL